MGELLASKAYQVCSRDHGYIVQSKYSDHHISPDEEQDDSCGNEGPENIDKVGDDGRATEAYLQELPRVEASPMAFACGIHTPGEMAVTCDVLSSFSKASADGIGSARLGLEAVHIERVEP